MSWMWLFCLIPAVEIAVVYFLLRRLPHQLTYRISGGLLVIGVVALAIVLSNFHYQKIKAQQLQQKIGKLSIELLQKGQQKIVVQAWRQRQLATIEITLKRVYRQLVLPEVPDEQ